MEAVKPAIRPATLTSQGIAQLENSDRTNRLARENSNKRLEKVDIVIIRKHAFAADLKPTNSMAKATIKQVSTKPGISENVKFARVPRDTDIQKSALEL